MKKDLCVIGAGPAGLFASLHIKSRDVFLIEEHKSLGHPLHCTGLVGLEVKEVIQQKLSRKLIDGVYNEIEFNIIGLGKFKISMSLPFIFHINRSELEWKLYEKISSRAELLNNVRGKPGDKLTKIILKDSEVECQDVLASDGALSIFRRKYLKSNPSFYIGFQGLFKTKNTPSNKITVTYINNNHLLFHWIVPLDHDLVLSGYISKKPLSQTITEKLMILNQYQPVEKKIYFGGPIPVAPPLKRPVLGGHLYFFGDSVPLVKPYTGGGLYNIVRLSPSIAKALDEESPEVYIRDYLRKTYINLKAEYHLTRLFEQLRYWIPAPFVFFSSKLGYLMPEDYDNHFKILLKTVPFTLLAPLYLLSYTRRGRFQ
ncbi:MAG: NAD(P)/FAD-dependent oxidoreductase [Thermosphaera sp.]